MSDGPALLAAIRAHPDEDTPRLAYADWLQEQGQDARAEFIRVQCRIAEVQRYCSCGSCVALHGGGQHTNGPCGTTRRQDDGVKLRERDLWATNWCSWVPAVGRFRICRRDVTGVAEYLYRPETDRAEFLTVTFRRGFVECVACTAADWLAHADAILAEHPVRRVRLTTRVDPTRLPRSFFRDPFPDWQHVAKVFEEHSRRQDEFGAPTFVTEREQWGDVFGRRWPGIEFDLPGGDESVADRRGRISPELRDAMAVAGLEESAPITRADWDEMTRRILTPPTE